MNAYARPAIRAAVLGAALGSTAAVPWLVVLRPDQHPASAALPAAIIAAALFAVSAQRPPASRGSAFRIGAPLAAALLTYAAVHATVALLPPDLAVSPERLVAASAVLLAVGFLARRRPERYVLAALLLICHPAICDTRALIGLPFARRACAFALPPTLPAYVRLAIPFLAIAALAATFSAARRSPHMLPSLPRALAAGLGVVAIAATTQLAAFYAALATGHSPACVLAVMTTVPALLAASAAVASQEWTEPRPFWLLRLCPLIPFALIAAIIATLNYGSGAYASLRRFHPNVAYTYIHFTTAGSWDRTIDRDGNTTKLWRCERFLAAYPRSAYRPAVLLMLAQSQYELWDFRAASSTLATLSRRYPDMHGYPEILRVFSSIASGDQRYLLSPMPPETTLSTWRRTQGALIAANAAERLGLPYRALGLYAGYANYLHSCSPASWTEPSVAYADSRSESILTGLKAGIPDRRLGSVSVTVLANGRPVPDARVVLVQPHRDAALPADSRQFTGAWTIPAWNAVWGTSGRQGDLTIPRIPYGTYDLVIGLPFSADLRGYVVSSAVPPVTVDRPSTALPPIELVRAVQLLRPSPGATVRGTPRLVWEPYPGASHYTVSLIAASVPRTANPPGGIASGRTCWVKTRVTTTSTGIDDSHLADGCPLQPGATYMWLVYAYDAHGRLISSSEHYLDLQEQAFRLEAQRAAVLPKGGNDK